MVGSVLDGFMPLLPVLGLVVVLGIVTVVITAFFKRSGKTVETDYSAYNAKSTILTKGEFSFYMVLRQILGEKYFIYPKVGMSDFIEVKAGEGYQGAFNRIRSKHVDFLICDKSSKVLLIVELDDTSHQRPRAQRADRFKDGLFEAVGIRCVRFKAQRSYNIEEVKRALLSKPVE